MRSDRPLHAIVQLDLAFPPVERRLRVAVVRLVRNENLVGADRALGIAHPVLNLTEERARLPQFGIERERALELLACVGVATLERRGHAGAEVEPRVLRIGGNRLAERLGRRVRLPGGQRVPRAALEKRGTRIDLRADPRVGSQHDSCRRDQRKRRFAFHRIVKNNEAATACLPS